MAVIESDLSYSIEDVDDCYGFNLNLNDLILSSSSSADKLPVSLSKSSENVCERRKRILFSTLPNF
jgi:hypothetical protein